MTTSLILLIGLTSLWFVAFCFGVCWGRRELRGDIEFRDDQYQNIQKTLRIADSAILRLEREIGRPKNLDPTTITSPEVSWYADNAGLRKEFQAERTETEKLLKIIFDAAVAAGFHPFPKPQPDGSLAEKILQLRTP